MNSYLYELKTCSPLILSPRASRAYYRGVHFNETDFSKNINIVYPFYQYGTYEKYDREHAEYYIPGSSIKGAIKGLAAEVKDSHSLMIDDIVVPTEKIKPTTIHKVQHIPKADNPSDQNKLMKLEPFFPNVEIEMLLPNTSCRGTLICSRDPHEILKEAQTGSIKKIQQLIERINQILELKNCNCSDGSLHTTCEDTLKLVKKNILSLTDKTEENLFLILLGGYKGLLLSGVFKEKDKGGIYIDPLVNLPYGLVTLQFIEKGAK